MARDREVRYATAQELADELRRFLTGQLLRSRRYRPGELLRDHPARAPELGLGALLRDPGAVALAGDPRQRQDPADHQHHQRDRPDPQRRAVAAREVPQQLARPIAPRPATTR